MNGKCSHQTISAEDAGYERNGIRQVIAVCGECAATSEFQDTINEAYLAFRSEYLATAESSEGENE